MSIKRISGRALQALRLRIWLIDPHCAMCGRLHDYANPTTFDLDHITALDNGGNNDDSNMQILCNGLNECHDKKTADDLGYKFRVKTMTGDDGWPVPVARQIPRWRRAGG